MRRATPLALALLLAFGASPAAPVPVAAAPGSVGADAPTTAEGAADVAPLTADGRYIVMLKDGRGVDDVELRAGRLGVTADRTFRNAVRGFSARLTPGQLAALRLDPDVAEIVPDEVITIAGQSIPTGVRRVGGRDSLVAAIDGSDPQVDADVAIVDTGIGGRTTKAHEDLNIVGGISCSTENPNSWGDPNGHGTHVAGTVGAIDNGAGVVGVAPGVRLWSVRILDASGNGLISWYVCGLDWIAAQRDPDDPSRPLIEAVNMSVARSGSDDGNCGYTNKDLMHRAICRLVDSGVTVVAAAGNNSFNASRLKPASYNEVITVSALADTDGKPGGVGGPLCHSWSTYDVDDTFADFSNYGHDVDLIAPGKCIFSTLPGNAYGYISGTSMAAPHVTGAAALYRSSRPDATPAQTRAALIAAGTLDWDVSTDPDSRHEPLLDVSHIVALGDFTVDATPGSSSSALVNAEGGSLDLPVQLIRAEDFPGAVDLAITGEAPLDVSLADTQLTGQDALRTTMTVAVPARTPSGTYEVTVTASDGSRERSSTFPIVIDSTSPTAAAPGIAFRAGGVLGNGVAAVAKWSPAADPGGSITRYQVRWRVDGSLGLSTDLGPSSRSVARRLVPGHTYALRVRARDAAGNWSAWAESEEAAPVLQQDASPSLTRTGTWKRVSPTWASGGTVLKSKVRGSSVTRTLTGRAIAWIGVKGAKRGRAKVYVDGLLVATVDLKRATVRHQAVVWTRSWATAGTHEIRIRVRGTKHRHRVDVDAFVILR